MSLQVQGPSELHFTDHVGSRRCFDVFRVDCQENLWKRTRGREEGGVAGEGKRWRGKEGENVCVMEVMDVFLWTEMH
jgi:hypothetical protein